MYDNLYLHGIEDSEALTKQLGVGRISKTEIRLLSDPNGFSGFLHKQAV
ncbi:CACNB4 isoform 57 [Pongo abelii]|uniref:CACNB4 isoform 57 n=1 Tax=Pongo abelii TaxID=9601 RepID=A0A2J8V7G3_PONAB|nr:CACNB4 isoform 57 [Pongo abelii]